MIRRLMILAGASGLLWNARASASCDVELTAAVLSRLSHRRLSQVHNEAPEHLLEKLLPDVALRVQGGAAVSWLRFRLRRRYGMGEVIAVREEASNGYRQIHVWELPNLRHSKLFALDVLPLADGWLAELQAKSPHAAERVQVYLKYSRRGVLETVTIAPGEAEAATLFVTYAHD